KSRAAVRDAQISPPPGPPFASRILRSLSTRRVSSTAYFLIARFQTPFGNAPARISVSRSWSLETRLRLHSLRALLRSFRALEMNIQDVVARQNLMNLIVADGVLRDRCCGRCRLRFHLLVGPFFDFHLPERRDADDLLSRRQPVNAVFAVLDLSRRGMRVTWSVSWGADGKKMNEAVLDHLAVDGHLAADGIAALATGGGQETDAQDHQHSNEHEDSFPQGIGHASSQICAMVK